MWVEATGQFPKVYSLLLISSLKPQADGRLESLETEWQLRLEEVCCLEGRDDLICQRKTNTVKNTKC